MSKSMNTIKKTWPYLKGPIIASLILFGSWIKQFIPTYSFAKLILKTTFTLTESANKMGVHFIHTPNPVHPWFEHIKPWHQAAGASVSVADVNNDGWYDFYLTNSGKNSLNQLYINDKNGHFVEQGEKFQVANINQENYSMGSLFFDCNNDGFKDLVILRECPALFINKNGKTFTDATSQSGLTQCRHYMTAGNFYDLDNDGDLDLILGAYYDEDLWHPKTSMVMPYGFLNSTNKAPLDVFINNGSCQFTKSPNNLGIYTRGWNFNFTFYHVDDSGYPILWVNNDYGVDSLFNWDAEKKVFKNIGDKISNAGQSRNGMGMAIADLFNQNQLFFYASHVLAPMQKTSGNILWQYKSDGSMVKTPDALGGRKCHWSWGSQFVDLDNNGFLDLVVVNGFITGKNALKNYWYNITVLDSMDREFSRNAKNWPPWGDVSLEGGTQNCLFYNTGKSLLNIVDKVEDFGKSRFDGRGVATIDINNNGSMSLIVANQMGPTQIYFNEQKNKNAWIGFNLVSNKTSAPSALGTRIKLYLMDGVILQKQHWPKTGFSSQNDDRIHFGLGTSRLNKIEVEWPHRKPIEYTDLKINSYNVLKEPQ